LDIGLIASRGAAFPFLLVLFGFFMGGLSGLFGVGGGFLVTPLLNILFGIPYEIAVGSSLCQMIGTSLSGTLRHHKLGNVDLKLAFITILSSALSIELGARLIRGLKDSGSITLGGTSYDLVYFFISALYIVLLGILGVLMVVETRNAGKTGGDDAVVRAKCLRRLHEMRIGPVISLPASEVKAISLPIVIAVGLLTGLLIGILGVGGGFVLVPVFIYLFCIPTATAIGTGIFQIVFASTIGAIAYSMRGWVDLELVIYILLGSTLGAQFGAFLTTHMKQKNLRKYFSYLVLASAAVVALKLLLAPDKGGREIAFREGGDFYVLLCVAVPVAFGLAAGILVPRIGKLLARKKTP